VSQPESAAKPAILSVRNLWAGYGARPAISGVTFGAGKGVTALIGSNGAGKSTSLKAITGLLKPTEGDITLRGKSIAGLEPNVIASLGVILVPEGGGLFPSMSVEDNLLMGAYLPRARARKADSLRAAFELFPRLRERRTVIARRLSGGEQQMLAISRALIALPEVLILDEPSLGLSPSMTDLVGEAVSKIAESGVSVLLCEQNAALALRISNYVYVMEHGKVVVEGDPEAMRRSEDVAHAYLGG
jgi:ABC-type branched-subunit amino acid transport system ATPase component